MMIKFNGWDWAAGAGEDWGKVPKIKMSGYRKDRTKERPAFNTIKSCGNELTSSSRMVNNNRASVLQSDMLSLIPGGRVQKMSSLYFLQKGTGQQKPDPFKPLAYAVIKERHLCARLPAA